MHFHHFASLLLLAILRPALGQEGAQGFGTCKASNGRAGECISTSQCKTNGGTSDPGNHCPGDQSIQCCTYGTCKGGTGICQPTSTCTGISDPGNFCPGPQNIQCCTPGGGGNPPGGDLPGLNAVQSRNARAIIQVARSQGVGNRGCQVSMVTALQESSIRILANTNVKESLNYPHDGVGSDHDSVGIFQQRPQFWGTVKDCMDATTSAGKFFNALKKVSGWQSMAIEKAAQAVQKSAFPDAYKKHIPAAQKICAAAGI